MPAFPPVRPEKPKKSGAGRWILIAVCAAATVFSAVKLAAYFGDAARSGEISRALRETYYGVSAEDPAGETAAPETDLPEPENTDTAPEDGAEAETGTTEVYAGKPAGSDWVSSYPDNPWLRKRERIEKLQKTNKDIVGWIGIEGVLDEAVVRRDNSWYLNHDYRNNKNANGALFLDESCPLLDRPPLYVIYGHNMKTGAMLGNLHKWEDAGWYHKHPLIHLEALYEEGDYVIFAAGVAKEKEIALAPAVYASKDPETGMGKLIAALENRSDFMKQIGVTEKDQVLLLVTCTGDDSERRFLAARKIREDETAEEMAKRAGMSWKK